MNRVEKETEVTKLKEKFAKAGLTVLTDYKGLKVNVFNDLRRKLETQNSSLKVVKNRLAKMALKGTSQESLTDLFKGTTAVTFAEGEATGCVKILVEFSKEHEALKFKGATLNGEIVPVKTIETLAKLPSREVLVAKMLGSMMAPARNLVMVLAQIPRQVVNVLAAVRDQKGKSA